MPKRLTDSGKWEDPWFMDLSKDAKIIWTYLVDKCDHAGIYELNLRLMSFQCGIKLTREDIKEKIGDRLIEIGFGKWFIPKFLSFQYASGLDSNKPVIVSVRKILNSHGLLCENNTINIPKSLNNHLPMIKSKSKDKDIDIDKDKSNIKSKDKETKFRKKLKDVLKIKTKQKRDVEELLKEYNLIQLSYAMDNWKTYNFESNKRRYCFSCNWTNYFEKIELFLDLSEVKKLIDKETKKKKNSFDGNIGASIEIKERPKLTEEEVLIKKIKSSQMAINKLNMISDLSPLDVIKLEKYVKIIKEDELIYERKYKGEF